MFLRSAEGIDTSCIKDSLSFSVSSECTGFNALLVSWIQILFFLNNLKITNNVCDLLKVADIQYLLIKKKKDFYPNRKISFSVDLRAHITMQKLYAKEPGGWFWLVKKMASN